MTSDSRRNFIIKGLLASASLALTGCSSIRQQYGNRSFKTNVPKKALIAWYGNTGHTARYARLMEFVWKEKGLQVDILEYRQVEKNKMPEYDIIMVGTPVYHLKPPINVRNWLEDIPLIDGVAVASYVAFGGPEGNQHNAATWLLELLAQKGGVPAGIDYFMNMSSFPTKKWDTEATIGHKDLPNEETYDQVRRFAMNVLSNISSDKKIVVERRADMRQCLAALPSVALTKIYYSNHRINKEKCVSCGRCVEVCPVGAIEQNTKAISRDTCLLCFGCFNNCPAQAVEVSIGDTPLYNFAEFMKRNQIEIREPKELLCG